MLLHEHELVALRVHLHEAVLPALGRVAGAGGKDVLVLLAVGDAVRALAVGVRVLPVRRELNVARHVVVPEVDLVQEGLLGVGGVSVGPQVRVPKQLAVSWDADVGSDFRPVQVVPLADLDDVEVAVRVAVGPVLADVPLAVDVRDGVAVDWAGAHGERRDHGVGAGAGDGLRGVDDYDAAASLVREHVALGRGLVARLHVHGVTPN
mmetsp:Transcript_9741/g.24998  ORF Transcript_9741/g.24998 Transcript_9741/m.24998 type:complete len:207 (+) Transcript_9741:626-1246(+)